MSNSIAPGSSADVNVRVTALTTNPNVPVTYKTIILKKNLVNGVNTLTQAMMNQTNTKYVIKYDYILGENITIPSGCVLEFDGGSISNAVGNTYNFAGTNTFIVASIVKIFDINVTLSGTWNITKAYPEWFGDINVYTLNKVFDIASINVYNVYLHGDVSSDEPIFIKRPINVISKDFTFRQTHWGYPGIIIDSDNVSIFGKLSVYSTVDTRIPVNTREQCYWPDMVDKKASSCGICFGSLYNNPHIYKNIYLQNVYIYNFIGGICGQNNGLVIDYIYVENVDFGIFGAGYYNTTIDTVEFKNIASYVGSEDPSHAVYLTGGSSIGLSQNVIINNLYGDGCISKGSDTVISVKSTEAFRLLNARVNNVAGFSAILNSTVLVENCVIKNAKGQIANIQLEHTKAVFKHIYAEIDSLQGYAANVTGGASLLMEDSEIVVNAEESVSSNCYIYIGTGNSNFRYCKVTGPNNSDVTVFGLNGNTLEAYDITTNLYMDHVISGNPSCKIYIDPTHIDPTKYEVDAYNDRFHFIILPNKYIHTAQHSNNPAIVGYNKVKIPSGSFQRIYSLANQVVYIFNGGNCYVNNNSDIKLRGGITYKPNEWTFLVGISTEPNKFTELYSDYTPST